MRLLLLALLVSTAASAQTDLAAGRTAVGFHGATASTRNAPFDRNVQVRSGGVEIRHHRWSAFADAASADGDDASALFGLGYRVAYAEATRASTTVGVALALSGGRQDNEAVTPFVTHTQRVATVDRLGVWPRAGAGLTVTQGEGGLDMILTPTVGVGLALDLNAVTVVATPELGYSLMAGDGLVTAGVSLGVAFGGR